MGRNTALALGTYIYIHQRVIHSRVHLREHPRTGKGLRVRFLSGKLKRIAKTVVN